MRRLKLAGNLAVAAFADGLFWSMQGLLYVAERLGADLDGGFHSSAGKRGDR